MAMARIKPASNGGVLLSANCTWGLLDLQSPSKQDSVCEIKGYKLLCSWEERQ